jgi:DNA-directed RNA polymerase subunit K/omega
MKRNSKFSLSLIAAAFAALLATGCATVGESADGGQYDFRTSVDRGGDN